MLDCLPRSQASRGVETTQQGCSTCREAVDYPETRKAQLLSPTTPWWRNTDVGGDKQHGGGENTQEGKREANRQIMTVSWPVYFSLRWDVNKLMFEILFYWRHLSDVNAFCCVGKLNLIRNQQSPVSLTLVRRMKCLIVWEKRNKLQELRNHVCLRGFCLTYNFTPTKDKEHNFSFVSTCIHRHHLKHFKTMFWKLFSRLFPVILFSFCLSGYLKGN